MSCLTRQDEERQSKWEAITVGLDLVGHKPL